MLLAFAFGGPADWVILCVVALVLFGPKKLPELAQQLGKAMREFRKVADEFSGAASSIRDEFTGAASSVHSEFTSVASSVHGEFTSVASSVHGEFTGAANSVRDEFHTASSIVMQQEPVQSAEKPVVIDQGASDLMTPAHSGKAGPGLVLSTVPPDERQSDAHAGKGH